MNDETRCACAHVQVEYSPNKYTDGSQSDRWQCLHCNVEFKPAQPTPPQCETAEQMFHRLYEQYAPEFNYETLAESAVPWENLPHNHKMLMQKVCNEVIAHDNAELREQSLRWYKADGSYEVLTSAEDVIAKRKQAAAELAELRQEIERLEHWFGELWGSAEFDCGPEDYGYMVEESIKSRRDLQRVEQERDAAIREAGEANRRTGMVDAQLSAAREALRYPRYGDTAALLDRLAGALEHYAAEQGDNTRSFIAPHARRAAERIRAALAPKAEGEQR